MPLLLIAVILGLVEGLTEFIPVSSTGHLIVAGHLLGFADDRAKAFEIFIQLGAILAVAWESRGTLFRIVAGMTRGTEGWPTALNLALGFLPSAVAGLALHGFIEEHLFSPWTVAWGLIIGGIGILLVERFAPRARWSGVLNVPWISALGVGLAQCLSLFPGMSRSACTIMGGMAMKLDRRTATEFSFLLAIPTMAAASLYDLWHWRHILGAQDVPAFAAGFVVSFISGLATVKFLLRYVATHDFRPFAYYRFVAGAIALWMFRGT